METAKVPAAPDKERVLSHLQQLETIRELRRQLQREDVDLRTFVLKLAEHPEAAERIACSANSALIGSGNVIRDLRHAVVYLGSRRVDSCLQATAQELERRAA